MVGFAPSSISPETPETLCPEKYFSILFDDVDFYFVRFATLDLRFILWEEREGGGFKVTNFNLVETWVSY